ncbi:MAG: bacteriohemerythrin [Ignavibacteriales bacterium]|nr:bacteriohemerythrin [Ignavibacteriales bacterium]
MALLNWSDSYSVGVKDVDLQHKKLVELINNLHDGMKLGKGKEILGSVLNELVSYTVYHFGFEEKLFEKYGYPETIIHKRQHADLVAQVKKFVEGYNNGGSVLTMDLMNFLKDWLTQHIAGSDKKYTSFFNSKGIA